MLKNRLRAKFPCPFRRPPSCRRPMRRPRPNRWQSSHVLNPPQPHKWLCRNNNSLHRPLRHRLRPPPNPLRSSNRSGSNQPLFTPRHNPLTSLRRFNNFSRNLCPHPRKIRRFTTMFFRRACNTNLLRKPRHSGLWIRSPSPLRHPRPYQPHGNQTSPFRLFYKAKSIL